MSESSASDKRDMRDPEKLGHAYLTSREAGIPIDRAINCMVVGYDATEGTATITAREYKQELQARADAGDKYALSALAQWGNPDKQPTAENTGEEVRRPVPPPSPAPPPVVSTTGLDMNGDDDLYPRLEPSA